MKQVLMAVILFNLYYHGIAQVNNTGKQKKYDARVRMMDGKVKTGRVVQYTRDSLYLDSIGNAIHYSRIQKIRLMRANSLKIFRNINPLAGTKNYAIKGEQSEYRKVVSKMDSVKAVTVKDKKNVQVTTKKTKHTVNEKARGKIKSFAQ